MEVKLEMLQQTQKNGIARTYFKMLYFIKLITLKERDTILSAYY